jgi:uncharacterized protein (TIGR03067 family)
MSPVLLALAVSLGAPAPKTPAQEALVGVWEVVSQTFNGQQMVMPSGAKTYRFTPDGLWVLRIDGIEQPTTPAYKLDPTRQPPTIDFTGVRSPTGPATKGAIYRLSGDDLTIAFGETGGNRPTAFESPVGSRVLVVVLRRAKLKE